MNTRSNIGQKTGSSGFQTIYFKIYLQQNYIPNSNESSWNLVPLSSL